MMDANGFEETETLQNGVAVKIRAIRPADKAGIPHESGPDGGRHPCDAVADRPAEAQTERTA